MADEVVLNKAAGIERCLKCITEEYEGHEDELERNYTRQEAIGLNLLRASEGRHRPCHARDMGRKAGAASGEPEAFALLERAEDLTPGAGNLIQ